MNKFYTCRYDTVFKAVICNNMTLLKAILKSVFDKEFNNIEILNSEMLKPHINVKSKTVDLLIKEGKTTIIVELNANERNNQRNFVYLCNEIANRTKVGEKYDTDYQFYQVNLSYNLKDEEDMRTYYMQDKEIKFIDNVCIIEYNMSKLRKYYEENNEEMIKKYLYLIMLDLDKDELKEFKKDGVVMEYTKKVNEVNSSQEYVPYLTVEEDNRFYMNTIKSEAMKEGMKEGFDKGFNSAIKKSIKALYQNGVSLEMIAKVNEMTVDEIKKIINCKEE